MNISVMTVSVMSTVSGMGRGLADRVSVMTACGVTASEMAILVLTVLVMATSGGSGYQ